MSSLAYLPFLLCARGPAKSHKATLLVRENTKKKTKKKDKCVRIKKSLLQVLMLEDNSLSVSKYTKKRSTYFGNVNKHEKNFLLGLSKMFKWDPFSVLSSSEHELVSFSLLAALSLFLFLSICGGTFF